MFLSMLEACNKSVLSDFMSLVDKMMQKSETDEKGWAGWIRIILGKGY